MSLRREPTRINIESHLFPVRSLSPQRQAVIDALHDAGKPLSPTEIVDAAGRTSPVNELLSKMAADGQARSVGYGKWTLPTPGINESAQDLASERGKADPPLTVREGTSGVRKGVRKGAQTFGRHDMPDRTDGPTPPNPVTLRPSQVSADSPALQPESDLVEIPLLVDIAAEAAGPNGGFLVDSDYFEIEPSGVFLPKDYVRQMYGVSPDRVYYIHGRGRSMVPTIMPGQRMMIALLHPGTAIRDGLIYVIDYAAAPLGGVLVKRLELTPDHVNVVSDNDDVADYLVPFEVWQRDYQLRAVVLETAVRH